MPGLTLSRLFVILSFLLFATSVFAQTTEAKNGGSSKKYYPPSRFYVTTSGGYGLGVQGKSLHDIGLTRDAQAYGTGYARQNPVLTLGQGIQFGVAAGYTINTYFSFNLAFCFMKSEGLQGSTIDHNVMTSGDTSSYKLHSNFISISPALAFNYPVGLFKPYIRLGLILGTGKLYEDDAESGVFSTGRNAHTLSLNYSGGIALGYAATIGNAVRLCRYMDLLQEISFTSITYAPSSATITSYTLNGQDRTQSLPYDARNFTFTDSANGSSSANSPSPLSPIHLPYSSIAFILGLRYHF